MNGKAKWVRVSWMAGALLPVLAGITSAANINSTAPQTNQPMQQDQQMATAPEQTAQFQPKLEKAKDILGAKVVNERGEQLGKIEDVVLTPDHQGVNYVVLSHGGVWGMADKYFAIPGYQFSPGSVENGKTFILKGVSKANLDQAPGFDKKHWPAMANENWLSMERSPGMPPAGGMMPQGSATLPAPAQQGTSGNPMYGTAQPTDTQHLRLSKLMGTTIRDAQNENIGRLSNIMIDMNQGKVAFGIVAARHGSLGTGKDFVAVPWSALNWTGQPGIAKVNVDRQTLASLAFSRNSFPNLADPQYSRQLFAQFHATPYWETPSLGFIPGQENPDGNPSTSEMTAPNSDEMTAPNADEMTAPNADEMTAPNSGTVAPNTTAPNSAVPQMVAYRDGYAYGYNPYGTQTFNGTVSRVITGGVPGLPAEEMGLIVHADNGRRIQVDLGPRGFVESQHMFFQPGERVTITGSLARVGDRTVLLASRIQTPYRIFTLRTPNGTPLWSLGQPGYPDAHGRGYDRYDRYAYPYGYRY